MAVKMQILNDWGAPNLSTSADFLRKGCPFQKGRVSKISSNSARVSVITADEQDEGACGLFPLLIQAVLSQTQLPPSSLLTTRNKKGLRVV